MADTPWVGSQADKLYLQSGQFTSTLKTSEAIGAIEAIPMGISYDGTNTPWTGRADDKLYLQSGQFTSTLKTSEAIGTIDLYPTGISWDGTNTPWAGFDQKLYLQSGQFTSTLKTSEDVSGIDTTPHGVSFDGTNTPWIGQTDQKLYLQSGQFTSTLKTSQSIGDALPRDISWDGTNTPWIGQTDQKLYLQSGQFTSTLKTSEDVTSIDTVPEGICTNDYEGRLGGAPQVYERSVNHAMSLTQNTVLTAIFNRSLSDDLSLNQTMATASIFNRSLSNDLSLNQALAVEGLEEVSSILSLNQAVLAEIDVISNAQEYGNRTLNRFIRRTLYNLKRQYGNRVDVYQLNDADTNYQTGEKSVDKTVNIVRKCIVLPVKIAREVVQTISHISANKMFVMGGSYDAGTRMFIIDTRDMPNNYEFTNDDWLIYGGRRYDIKSIEEFEYHTAWSIIGKEVRGVRPEQVFFAHITERLELEQDVERTVV
jgi:hypothetical protein